MKDRPHLTAALITLSLYLYSHSAPSLDIDECVIEPFTVCSGAQLSNANLAHADLSGAALSEANMSGANLSNANLSSANLTGANLANPHTRHRSRI